MHIPSAIQTFDLTRRFGDIVALDHMNLTVETGKMFGLLGPNGAGKSTAIKILTTLLEPSAGSAKVGGFDIERDPSGVRAHIGYVPQMLSADGALTGRENLLLSARMYGIPRSERKERIREMLLFMQLEEMADKLVKKYSGGMIRRLELAQAMLHRPIVLFLDEPTIGLDPMARRMVWDHLKNLRNEYRLTVLITTHDMEEADSLCDELVFLHRGKVVAGGCPAELKSLIGPNADLNDVFDYFSGAFLTAEGEGGYRDVRRTRNAASRHS
ncbi:MAG: ATP-binding cassette domain-containing protein [Aminobacteriaceae bacterium]|jgi:ABC-2 type transport system ATP-binding protein